MFKCFVRFICSRSHVLKYNQKSLYFLFTRLKHGQMGQIGVLAAQRHFNRDVAHFVWEGVRPVLDIQNSRKGGKGTRYEQTFDWYFKFPLQHNWLTLDNGWYSCYVIRTSLIPPAMERYVTVEYCLGERDKKMETSPSQKYFVLKISQIKRICFLCIAISVHGCFP